ncbi:TBC1 domain family member 15-like isoform X2 [Mauremys mutica]|uniref:TBC1 domain family member 15-like isoform X2 n=1 Tax=Mauremys mutica TaxID=74926 RepID=UPI001D169B00|nr:TBC1 domain family member 15-like isoform X2 [Mauremys mutica]
MKGGVVLRLLLYWLRALSRRIVATWQRGAAGTGDWSKIQEQPPRRHVDGDGTCIHGPESQLPATSSLQSLFDGAGRLDLAGLRKVVYETGMDASERKVTWKFLFGVYPADSTTEERRRLDQQLVARYRSMKNAWKQQFPSAKRMKVQSDLELSLAIMKYEQQEMEAAKVPAEHGLWLQSINQPQFWASLRDIDADVPRTDRHRSFFQRQGLVKLLYLREILITFAAFHQDIGYCQGMTSFASHFLETLDSEFDAFWCFVNCMRHWAPSLTAQGVACKIQTTEELLRHVDPELHHHIARTSKERLLFCLSWLLLRFQRELGHEDALRVMEIGALEGDPTELAARLLPHCREGEDRSAPHRDGVSFEVLLCVALLIQHRQQLLQYQHVHDFFLFAHRLQGKLALDALRRVDRPL